MAFLHRSGEKRKSTDEYAKEEEDKAMDMSDVPGSKHAPLESEKRMRREIANSNERRRMQSINAGFQSLKSIIPHHEGEKLSKAAILQQTTEYISNLEQDKVRLLSQNSILRQMLKELNCDPDAVVGPIMEQITPPPKRKKRDTESSDEGISLGFDEPHIDELKKEVIELRIQLDREKKMRVNAEDRYQRSLPSFSQASEKEVADLAVETHMKQEKKMESEFQAAAPAADPAPPPAPAAAVVKVPPGQTQLHPAAHDVVATTTKTPVSSTAVPQQGPRMPVFASAISKRNLETIVEAIRHLEGDHMLEGWKESSHGQHHIPQSEESQPESSSDAEDMKSDSSGRDSPLLCQRFVAASPHHEASGTLHHAGQLSPGLQQQVPAPTATAPPKVIVDTKWHLLQQAACLVGRPGVIVQKSS